MTKETTIYSAIKPSSSKMSKIRKSVANIQHTRHIRRAIAAILITYDKHPLIIVCHLIDLLFRGLFKLLYEKLDKLVRQCQAVNSHLQICESSAIDCYTGTNQVLMSENPVSQCFLEIFLEGLKKVVHCYYKLKMIFYLLYLFIYLYDKMYQKERFQF